MNALDESILMALLANDGTSVFSNESDIIEFKSEFDWSNKEKRAKYCKSFAAFSNNKGGYLFFGIDDKTKTILGITGFDQVDSASISDHINNYFAPGITFHKRSIALANKQIGIIYIEKCHDIPTICIKGFDTILKDGALFYRYPGKSDYINGTDLIHLLHQLKSQESKESVLLKKLEMKENSRPILALQSGGSEGHMFEFKLKNIGKRCRIDEILITKGNFNIVGDAHKRSMETNAILTVQAINQAGFPAGMVHHEIEIYYSDFIGNKYLMKGAGIGAQIGFSEPVDVQ
ncbi:MAG: ATP-binding protein [Chitinophagales bacterium]